jgi:hypothetical protein
LYQWFRNQTYQRSGSWDHFITLARITWDFQRYGDDEWDTNFVVMPRMENVTRLGIKADPMG